MLLKVSAANFKSFNEAVTLDLVSSTKVRSLASHVVSLGEMKILRNAAIYGANASGKTNLYRILRFLQDSLRNGRIPLGTGDWFCKLSESNKEKETILDIQYETKGRFFDYGFSALLADRRIVSEWLYELSPSGKRWNAQVVFERYEDSSPVIGNIENLSNDEKSRFEVYAGDFPLKSDKLFFSELNRGKTYLPDSALGVLPVAFDCLVSGLRVIGAGESRARFDSFLKDDYLEKASRLLSGFDTGIKQIKKKSLPLAELRDLVPEPIFRDMEEAVTELEELYKRSFNIPVKDVVGNNPELVYAYRTRSMLRVALTVAYGALNRQESRGAHYREDFSVRDDVKWLNRTIATWKDGDTLPTLSYQPLDISKMELPPGFRGYGVKNYIENPESAKRQAEVDAIRQKMEAEGKDRWAIQDAIMPYQHLLPKRLLGRNERIDEPLNVDGDGNELLLSDVLGSDENLVGLQLEQAAERATLRRSVEQLAPRERQIMELRFGLLDGVERTQKEVADAIGISQSYISRLEKRIIRQLREQLGE